MAAPYQPPRPRRRSGGRASLWRSAAPRDRSRHVHPAAPPLPRRTGGRAERARDRGPERIAAVDSGRGEDRPPPHRARYERRHAHLRPHRRARLRQDHRRRYARGGAQRSEGHRRLSRRAGRGGRRGRTGGQRVSDAILDISDVTAGYGNIHVLHDVSLTISKGEVVALIGANGAGKTTLMMTIFGRPRASRGSIRFEGGAITDLPP